MTFANITLSGTVKHKADQRFTPSDVSVVSFKMDIMRYDGRDKQEKAHEITINLWGDAYAEKVAEITPGKQVLVIGRPQIDQFTDRGGNTQRSFVVEASSFHFLSELAANSEMPTSQPSAAMPSAQPAANPSADNMMDEEIPF